ncbi:MAG: hypothetical protein ACREVE_03840 [Gammaproteobacteria bacterium]
MRALRNVQSFAQGVVGAAESEAPAASSAADSSVVVEVDDVVELGWPPTYNTNMALYRTKTNVTDSNICMQMMVTLRLRVIRIVTRQAIPIHRPAMSIGDALRKLSNACMKFSFALRNRRGQPGRLPDWIADIKPGG